VVGSIAPDGKPEVGAVDGEGHVFVISRTKATIAVLDIAARKNRRDLCAARLRSADRPAYDAGGRAS